MRTVSELATLAGVSVRTLHHYDELGLLRPDARTEAGYRQYGDDAARRLHEILFWRELGFPLEEVKALLDDPGHDPVEAMRLRREHLRREIGALGARVEALDAAIARAEATEAMTSEDFRVLFDGFDPASFADEARERWGHTDAWAEARRRTARYGPADWAAMKADAAALAEELAAAFRSGVAPDSVAGRRAARAHRAHLERWFYAVPAELHLGLARTYLEDPRFAAVYDAKEPGLAAWLAGAITALHAPERRTL
jgi:DNA-binding transcriptional MerR regulator